MMNQLNLRKRILLGYLVPMLLMVGVCVAVVWNTQDVMALSKSLEYRTSIFINIKDAHLAVVRLQRSARGYLLIKNDQSLKTYNEDKEDVRNLLQVLNKTIDDPKQIDNLKEINGNVEHIIALTGKGIQLVNADQMADALTLFGSNIEVSRALDKAVSVFELRETELFAQQQLAQRKAIQSLMTLVLITTAAAFVLALGLAWWIATRISHTIVEAVTGLGTSSTEIAATVEEYERVVTQQAAAVNQTTSTVEELGASSRQSATQAEAAAEAAQQAFVVTQDGIQLANQASASMSNMKQKVELVAEKILQLSEQAGQIGSIAKVVGELAGETNMLALNAAVEAARAGEHGKGFAVVATEVRKLAEQSKKSAERANALVAEIQKATNSAVMVTEQGTTTAAEVGRIIDQASAAFTTISNKTNSVAVNAQQVLLNSRQQAAALGQVTEAMKSLAAGASQMAAGTDQTKKGMFNLKSIALGLQAMV